MAHNRAAGFPPGFESTVNMANALEAHALCRVRGERGAPASTAIKYEALVCVEQVLEVGAVGIDLYLEHTAWHVKAAGHLTVVGKLSNIT